MWISDEERRQHAEQESNWQKMKRRRCKAPRPNKKQRRWEKQRLKQQIRIWRAQSEKKCRDYLKEFWPKFSAAQTKEERLDLLKSAAHPGWELVHKRLKQSIRGKYFNIKVPMLPKEIVECGCCIAGRAREQHHIVPVAYGGVNERINILKICLECHNLIHPWMARK